MEVVHARCAGMDISKKDAKVCVRIAGAGRRKTTETVTTWGSMTSEVLALRDHLLEQQVTCVVMEATSDYWKPFYYLLEDLPGVELLLANARHVKTVPGRNPGPGSPFKRTRLAGWDILAPECTTRGRWGSSRHGSEPMVTAGTIWSGCGGRRGSSARTASRVVGGVWVTAGSAARGAGHGPR